MSSMRILTLEDELPASKKLEEHLRAFFAEDLQIDHARSVHTGLEYLQGTVPYDLILSDIKLLDGNCFEVFGQVDVKAPIIFCTAYDEHLLEAFRSNGIAYILKPYQKADIEEALGKYRTLFQATRVEQQVYHRLESVLGAQQKSYKSRFVIKKQEAIKLLAVQDIAWIEADGHLCKLYDTQGVVHLLSANLGTLSDELDPGQFFRINRSQLVNIAHITQLEPYVKNRLAITLRGTAEPLTTSSTVTREFRQWLEG